MKFNFSDNSKYNIWIFITLSSISAWALLRFVIFVPLQKTLTPISSIPVITTSATSSAELKTSILIPAFAKRLSQAVLHNPEFSRIDYSQPEHVKAATHDIAMDQYERIFQNTLQIPAGSKALIIDNAVSEILGKIPHSDTVNTADNINQNRKLRPVDLFIDNAPFGYIRTVAFINSLVIDYSRSTLPEIDRIISPYKSLETGIASKQSSHVFGLYIRSRLANSTYGYLLDEAKYPDVTTALLMLERDYSSNEPVQCVGWVALLNAIPGIYLAENIAGYALRPDAKMITQIIDSYNIQASLPPILTAINSRKGRLAYYAGQNNAFRLASIEDIQGGDVGFYENHTFAVVSLFRQINKNNSYGLDQGDYLLISESNRNHDGLPRTYFVPMQDFDSVVAPIGQTIFLRSRTSRPEILEESNELSWIEAQPIYNKNPRRNKNNPQISLQFKFAVLQYLLSHMIRRTGAISTLKSLEHRPLAELAAYHIEQVTPSIFMAWNQEKPRENISDFIAGSTRFWRHAIEIITSEVESTYLLNEQQ